jgi:hypothetical protein
LKLMRMIAVAVASAALIVNIAAAAGSVPKPEPVRSAAPSPTARTLGVDEFMSKVARYKGPVTIQGIVTAVVPQRRLLALVDTGGYKESRSASTRSGLTLPVIWSGTMPKVKEMVRVEGQIREVSKKKLVFVAKRLEKVGPRRGAY